MCRLKTESDCLLCFERVSNDLDDIRVGLSVGCYYKTTLLESVSQRLLNL